MYHPTIFSVSFTDNHHHRVATCGGMDSEYSHTTRETFTEYVVASDLETAQFLWSHRGRNLTSRTDIVWVELGPVTLMMTAGYGIY
jgi:hypothetical protein